jgi:uncharacterized protein (DUF362 family)
METCALSYPRVASRKEVAPAAFAGEGQDCLGKNGGMIPSMPSSSRRQFLQQSLALAATFPAVAARLAAESLPDAPRSAAHSPVVAIVGCASYSDADVRAALQSSFDIIGGLKTMVVGKTVTIKVNLTGQDFSPFLDLPVGETYMTHFATAYHAAALIFAAGARRVRFVESTGQRKPLESTLTEAGWNVNALSALGTTTFENTRNRGSFDSYAHLEVPGGLMFSSFDVNRAYADTDVVVSLAKLKQHKTAGVTLTMKNMFGMTPNSMFGGKAGDEDATSGRGAIHDPRRYVDPELPGQRPEFQSTEAGVRVPCTVADICAARPVNLAIIDGISSITGAESRYFMGPTMRVVRPGVLIVGRNPVSVDAVGTAVMGFDPRANHADVFARCDNHLLLAERNGLGNADLRRIDIRGLTLDAARHPYA